ncbi:hypothetical protein BDV38DRAFT_275122 [Aspergillus pseudotamarii]|uniref:LDB19 N-terminal domain-containing protein n=1 Tax=Aspergillus pseudotamarii TaxID=132259 RepID=A0A5N6SGC4_ASPPS|nr:uncharacterized protein BDV38DRAFT_275122 [Aspergillus pseudotamarii]KAE8132443.1 hypothetical protein BDV38DRAFT_275122 [Aspergillus pseudotamarii]
MSGKPSSVPDTKKVRLGKFYLYLAFRHVLKLRTAYKEELCQSSGIDTCSTGHLGNGRMCETAKLTVMVESPPLIFHGEPTNSMGALFSGILRFTVGECTSSIEIVKLKLTLGINVTTTKPVVKACPSCVSQIEELQNWNFITRPMYLTSGHHEFPFSYLFPGQLPASCNSPLGDIRYILFAQAEDIVGRSYSSTLPLHIKRALPPGNEISLFYTFPPTNLTSHIVVPSVVHPMGSFPVRVTLRGVLDKENPNQNRLYIQSIKWQIKEHVKIVSHPCSKHASKARGKSVIHQDTRTIASSKEKSGSRYKFDLINNETRLQFEAGIDYNNGSVCDILNTKGVEVKHSLIIELIAEDRNTWIAARSGASVVLRMCSGLRIFERSGLGISWDKEVPPIYTDVPPGPPGYIAMEIPVRRQDTPSRLTSSEYA